MSYIKRKSQKQEKRTAKEFGGKLTPASGALSGAKGDVRTGVRDGSRFNQQDFLIENKFTDKSSYSLKLSIWEKIELEALRDNFRTPLMQIDIQDLQVVVINRNDLESIAPDYVGEILHCVQIGKKSCSLKRDSMQDLLDSYYGIDLELGGKHLVILRKDKFLEMEG